MNGIKSNGRQAQPQKRQHMTLHPMQLEALMSAIIASGFCGNEHSHTGEFNRADIAESSRKLAKEIVKQIKEDMPL